MTLTHRPENHPKRVKEVRRQLGLSQEELAHAIGVSFATINRWENGKTAPSKLAIKQFTAFCTTQSRHGALKLDKQDNICGSHFFPGPD